MGTEAKPRAPEQPLPRQTGAIANYLTGRQQLMKRLMKLNAAIDDGHTDVAEVLTIRLCRNLVDYLSYGHFRVFGSYGDALQISPLEAETIERTTAVGLRFADRFAEGERKNLGLLKGALAELAYVLTDRFEVEDDLFALRTTGRNLAFV